MAFTQCMIDGQVFPLEFNKDLSDNSHSGILFSRRTILFSYSDELFIPLVEEKYQQAIRLSIRAHEQNHENDFAPVELHSRKKY